MIDGLLKLGPNQEVGNQPLHARSIENHKSAVDREPWLPCRSVHPPLTIQIETAALPLHNPNRTCYQGTLPPGPRSLRFPMQSVATPATGTTSVTIVGRYPGPRRPGARSVATPIPSAATPVRRPSGSAGARSVIIPSPSVAALSYRGDL